MKRFAKYVVTGFLGIFARAVVRRYRPQVVMVTGSVGKTTTKDAVAAVLATRFFLRKSEKSFNSEFGVPLTIFGVPNPERNIMCWLGVAKSALALLLLPNHYPNLLVLEVGADRPRDLAKILRIATPQAVVVTRLPEVPVHVEAYATPEDVREEEFSPAYALPPAAPLVYASEDAYARRYAARVSARPFTYGESADASVRLSDASFYAEDGRVLGMRARVETAAGESGELIVKGSVGKTQLLPGAAAIATGLAFGVPLTEALAALAAYEPPPGRGRLLAGKYDSTLVDETYNASPAAMEAALATLHAFPGAKRRVAVLGDMLELGRYSVAEHERIGALAAQAADLVVTVGVRARRIGEQATKAGAEVIAFDDSRAAAAALLPQPGDVILVKGSQSMRTERIVHALLADPLDTARLVRQDRAWQKRG